VSGGNADVVRIVNVIVGLVTFQPVTSLSMSVGVFPDVNMHGAVGKNGDGDGGGCPKGLQL
jgi:hypothetical protein